MSNKIIGRQFQFGVSKETTRGTIPASVAFWQPFTDLSFDEKKKFAVENQAYGLIEDSVGQMQVMRSAEGSCQGDVGDQTIGLLLLSLLGTDTPTTHAGETIVYDHALTVQESTQHQSLSFYIHDLASGQDYAHANGMVEKLEISYEINKFISFNASLKAKTGATESAYTVANVTENHFVPQYLTFKTASAYSGLSAATAIKIKSAKITISQNIEEQQVLGSLDPADWLNKQFKVDGQIEAIWQNEADFKTAFMAGTPQALRFDLKNTDVIIGSTTNPELLIDFAKVYFTELSRPVKVGDFIYQTIKFSATYSVGDALMMKATLTNLKASY